MVVILNWKIILFTFIITILSSKLYKLLFLIFMRIYIEYNIAQLGQILN